MLGGKSKLFLVFCALPIVANADVLPLNDALRATYSACVGIDDELADLKKMAGINTAVTGVGTGLGIGATTVGIIKYATDKEAESYEKLLEELREIQKDFPETNITDEEISAFEQEFNLSYDEAVKTVDTYQSELDKLNNKSKNLGNWRTGQYRNQCCWCYNFW